MRGSLYPDGVLVDRTALRRTETSKSDEIKRDRVNVTSGGILSGGAVSVNGTDPTRIDVAIFSGYAPNGEYIETTSAYYSIALDDYTALAVNYLVAVYTESNVGNQPHETDGLVYPTEARMAWRIRVYEESNFQALSATDSNLANDAQDRCLLIAKITANGAAVPLTTSNISSPTEFDNILTTTPVNLTTITGITVLGVSADTLSGAGTLSYSAAAYPNCTVAWRSYGATGGAAVTIAADGDYTVLDSLSNTIRLNAVHSMLPVSGTATETITVSNIYEQDVLRYTGEDLLHRNKIGTGIITNTNAHGLSVADIEGAVSESALEEHQDVMHHNGIWRDSYGSTFSGIIDTGTVSGDTFTVYAPISGDLYYVNGKKLSTASNNTFYFTPANFTAGLFGATHEYGSKLYELYVDDEGVCLAGLRADTNSTAAPAARAVTGTWIVDMSDDHPAGDYDLVCVRSGGGGGTVQGTYTFSWGLNGGTAGQTVVIDNSSAWTAPEGEILRLFDATGINWIDLYVNRSASGLGDSELPTINATYTDTITVTAHKNYDQNLKLLSIVYWYNPSGRGTLGWDTDFLGATNQRHFIDRRTYGTLGTYEISDSALAELTYTPTDELHHSGILFARDELGGGFVTSADTTGLDFPITGGHYYFRGKRLYCEGSTTFTVTASKTSLVYINSSGAIASLNITDDFSGDVSSGIAWLLGETYDRSLSSNPTYTSSELTFIEKGIPLYLVTAGGSDITDWIDISRNVNGPVDDWSVGGRRSYSWNTPAITVSTPVIAAFDSLEAAFLYQEVYGFSDIKVVGECYIFYGRPITQATGVCVRGGQNFSRVLSYIDTVVGWVLSDNCVMRDLVVISYPSTTGAGGFIELNDSVKVDRVYGGSNRGAENNYAFFTFPSAGTCVYTVVSDCTVYSDGPIFYGDTHCNVSNFTVRNCVFGSTGSRMGGSPTYFIPLGQSGHVAEKVNFLNNKIDFSLVGATADSYLVHITGNGCKISGNTIVAAMSRAAAELGYMITVKGAACTVSDNTLIGYASGGSVDYSPTSYTTSVYYSGIYLDSCTNCKVTWNHLTNLYRGVFLVDCVTVETSSNSVVAADTGFQSGESLLASSSFISVFSNTFSYTYTGVLFGTVDYATVFGNRIDASTYGIYAGSFSGSQLQGNWISYTSGSSSVGIYSGGGTSFSVEGNRIYSGSHCINSSSALATILNNFCTTVGGNGLLLTGADVSVGSNRIVCSYSSAVTAGAIITNGAMSRFLAEDNDIDIVASVATPTLYGIIINDASADIRIRKNSLRFRPSGASLQINSHSVGIFVEGGSSNYEVSDNRVTFGAFTTSSTASRIEAINCYTGCYGSCRILRNVVDISPCGVYADGIVKFAHGTVSNLAICEVHSNTVTQATVTTGASGADHSTSLALSFNSGFEYASVLNNVAKATPNTVDSAAHFDVTYSGFNYHSYYYQTSTGNYVRTNFRDYYTGAGNLIVAEVI